MFEQFFSRGASTIVRGGAFAKGESGLRNQPYPPARWYVHIEQLSRGGRGVEGARLRGGANGIWPSALLLPIKKITTSIIVLHNGHLLLSKFFLTTTLRAGDSRIMRSELESKGKEEGAFHYSRRDYFHYSRRDSFNYSRRDSFHYSRRDSFHYSRDSPRKERSFSKFSTVLLT